MANQVIVTSNNTVQVAIEPTPNVEVTISRTAIGTVANVPTANYANYAGNAFNVDASNVSGLGNIATINLSGNSAQLLLGNGAWGAIPSTANSNYANYAGNAFAVDGANVNGAVANATFANDASNANIANVAYSVDVANVVGIGNIATINLDGNVSNALLGDGTFGAVESANANYANFAGNAVYADDAGNANIANTAYSVDGANVNGTVANATYALDAGNSNYANTANVANIAYSVDGANVNGTVANATYALDAGNSNYANTANVANIAYSVDGANVNGTVANATYALDAGNSNYANTANVANIAYSVDGANVSGAVANATFADDAANANIANIAYSVDVANVSGIGNIATINLDGNVANALLGNGTWGPVELTTAQTVTDNAQPNITSVGNLTSLTVNNTTSGNTLQFIPNGSNIGNTTYIQTQTAVGDSRDVLVLNVGSNLGSYNREFLATNGTNTVPYAYFETLTDDSIGTGNVAVPGSIALTVYTPSSNLTSGDQSLRSSLSVGQALNYISGAPTGANVAVFQTFNYGMASTPNSSTALRFTRRRGTGSARLSLEPNDYLGNIEWRGAQAGGGQPAGQRFAKIAPRVDSSYVANTAAQPVGIEFWVTDNTTARSHSFYANGNVQFNNLVTANVISANTITGTLTTNAQPNVTSVGNLTSLTVNNTTSGNTLRFNPNGTTISGNSYIEVQTATDTTKDALILNVGSGTGEHNKEFLATNGTNTVPFGIMEVFTDDVIGAGNVATPGSIGFTVYTPSANLTTGDLNLRSGFTVGQALNFISGAPLSSNAASFQTITYGLNGAQNSSTALRFTRRRGNGSARLSLEPNDYLGNIEWRGAQAGGAAPTGQRFAKIAPRVDSSYVANTAAQPVGIEFWVTDNTTARSHTFYANGNVQFNNAVIANTFSGNGSGLTGITASQISSGTSAVGFTGTNGNLFISTNSVNNGVSVAGRNVILNGIGQQPPGNGVYSTFNVNNGAVNIFQDNIGGGLATFDFKMYENTTSYLNPYTFFRARGTRSSPQAIANNDSVMSQSFWCYSGPSNTYVGVGYFDAQVKTNDGAGNVSSRITLGTQNTDDGSEINLITDNINLNGDVYTPNTLNVNSNINLYANGRIDYLRTFGSFSSNATQTSNGANTTNYITFNNTEDANGVSIVSSSQLTVARTGRYNIQFSAVLTHSVNQTANVEIWLTKNGSAVANTNTRLTVVKGQATPAAWNFVDNVSSANTYYQIAWASPDTSVQLTATDSANTIAGVAIPSVIATITPVGA